ncbi:Phenylalanine--tRNA ligase beta subunit [compost metagenome]
MGYSFIREGDRNLFLNLGEGDSEIKLAMPMSEDRSVLRGSLLPGLIDIAQYNHNRKLDNLALFEIGNVFHASEEKLSKQPNEMSVLAVLLTGDRSIKGWNNAVEKVDFFDLKGVLESVFEYLGLADLVTYEADAPKGLHPGRSASVFLNVPEGKLRIGIMGQLHPVLQSDKELNDTFVAEIKLEKVYRYAGNTVVYRDLPRFPASERDIAVVVDAAVEAGALITSIKETAGELLESVQVFDVFTGSKLGEGKKSIALSVVYRHMERTLTDEEITAAHDKVVETLEQTFAAELRK